MQAAIDAVCKHVMPDTASAVSAVKADEARPHLRADVFVILRTLARLPVERGMEAGSGDKRRRRPSLPREAG